jgi:hypothetical protein
MIDMQAIDKQIMSKRTQKIMLAPLGEYYADLLTLDSWINGRANAGQAHSLLCSKLMEREARIKERIEYLASKRGIDARTLWMKVLRGEADAIEASEIVIEDEATEND